MDLRDAIVVEKDGFEPVNTGKCIAMNLGNLVPTEP